MNDRWLPDVDALLLDILIPKLQLLQGQVGESLPASLASTLPFVHAYRWGGSSSREQRIDHPVCDVHCWASSRTEALDLGDAAGTALYEAWSRQLVYDHGSICSFEEQTAPSVMPRPDQLDGITVVQATYRLSVCPPVTP